jgi:4-hydroxy-2-oxoheptanedioate aldolase
MGTFGNVSMTDYLQQANDALLTIVQIETKEALETVSKSVAPECLFQHFLRTLV